MEFVTRKNPGGVEYEIPKKIADLMEKQLRCINALKATNGLRWEHNNKGTIFFHKITRTKCSIYILPSTVRRWKTKERLQALLKKLGHGDLVNEVSDRRGGNKHLEIHNVSWDKVEEIAADLVDWVYLNETGQHIVKTSIPRKNEKRNFVKAKRRPTEKHVQAAIEKLPSGETKITTIFSQMETNALAGRYEFVGGWEDIVRDILEKLSEK
jgi:hypothetical protein